MATKSKADKSRPDDAGEDFLAGKPTEMTIAADAPVETAAEAAAIAAADAVAPSLAQTAAPEPEIADSISAPLAVIEEAVESATDAFSASFQFDSSGWSKKSIDLWAENAAAFLDLAEEIGRAKTFEDVIDIQSRFASERFAAFIRQSQELMDLARNVATLSVAPLCGAQKAA
ncbi:MAG: phasin family protein [Methylocystis sp.]|uniref:phasin family protein n=1 Tax=Methylocystis sp. TaxID=1911079 RepID=UPI003DA4BEB8